MCVTQDRDPATARSAFTSPSVASTLLSKHPLRFSEIGRNRSRINRVVSNLKLRSDNCLKWRPPKKRRPVLQQPVPLSKLDPLPESLRALMVSPSWATHQVIVHLEQHTAYELLKRDRSSIDRWFLDDSILTEEAGFVHFHLVAFLF